MPAHAAVRAEIATREAATVEALMARPPRRRAPLTARRRRV
jgi:hypothetical protein